MRTFGHTTSAMGATVHKHHPETISSTRTCIDSGVLCRGRREASPSLCNRNIACVVAHLTFPFFAGLAVYLFKLGHTFFRVATSWIRFCTGMYMCITLMPMFWHDSPYYALFSSSVWYLCAGIRFILARFLSWIPCRCNLRSATRRRKVNLQHAYEDLP